MSYNTNRPASGNTGNQQGDRPPGDTPSASSPVIIRGNQSLFHPQQEISGLAASLSPQPIRELPTNVQRSDGGVQPGEEMNTLAPMPTSSASTPSSVGDINRCSGCGNVIEGSKLQHLNLSPGCKEKEEREKLQRTNQERQPMELTTITDAGTLQPHNPRRHATAITNLVRGYPTQAVPPQHNPIRRGREGAWAGSDINPTGGLASYGDSDSASGDELFPNL